jgi:phage terminase small subunit
MFVSAMARTNDQTYSAAKAGYGSPQVRGSELMGKPAIRAAVIRETEEALFNEILPLALAKHRLLLTASGVPAGAQLGAVKLAYDRTLGAAEDQAGEKEPSEMSYDELQASIGRLRREQESREEQAKDVTPEPDIEPHSIMD